MKFLRKTLTFLFFSFVLSLPFAMAQDVLYGDDYDWDSYQPYGDVEMAYDAYDDSNSGAIILRHSTPDDQHANFDVVGPNDYWNHFDFSDDVGDERVLDGLEPGFYSVAATDEGLELSHTVVEVRVGETVTVTANLRTWDQAYLEGSYDPYTNWGQYDGYDTVYPGYPYGVYGAGPYENYDGSGGAIILSGVPDDTDVVITGPNGFSEAYDGNTTVEDLAPGVYAIAARNEGADISVTTVEIKEAQQLPLSLSMMISQQN